MPRCRPCAMSAVRSLLGTQSSSYLSASRVGITSSSVSQIPNAVSVTFPVASLPRPQDITKAIRQSSKTESAGEREEDGNRWLPHGKRVDYAVRKHLEFLGDDRFKIAKHVLGTLQRDAFDEALHLVRKISKPDRDYMVSWNHLIDHLFQKQRMNAAMKLYNEAKKRGQTPNAQTYTIIFDGCAASDHPKLAVGEAVRLYHILLRSDRLKPNTKHLNAVLKVCSRAGDQEAMFTVLQTAEGERKADNLTYTTILNALRVRAVPSSRRPEHKGLKKDEREGAYLDEIKVSIQRARAIWEEIVKMWRSGKLFLDEELVCAMGRILKTGDRADNHEILSLIEQSMNIPRLDKPALPTPLQSTEQTWTNPRSRIGFATPGKNTLSLVLESLGTTRQTSLAARYWDLFVKEYGVRPDSENWFRLLRTLWIGRASSKAAEFIIQMPPQFLRPSTVHVAMGTCVRDSLNDSATANADKILSYAIQTLGTVDALTMRYYLQVVLANDYRFNLMAEKADVQNLQAELGKRFKNALQSLQKPLMKATKNLRPYRIPQGPLKGRDAIRYNEFRELAATARRMISVADKIMNQKLVSDEKELKWIKGLRVKMQFFVDSVYQARDQLEPKLPGKPESKEYRYDSNENRESDSHDWTRAAATEVRPSSL